MDIPDKTKDQIKTIDGKKSLVVDSGIMGKINFTQSDLVSIRPIYDDYISVYFVKSTHEHLFVESVCTKLQLPITEDVAIELGLLYG